MTSTTTRGKSAKVIHPAGSYSVVSCSQSDFLKKIARQIPESSRLVLVTDANVDRLYGRGMMKLLSAGFKTVKIVLPAGESHKNLRTVRSLYANFIREKVDRGTTVVAFGGGVTGDIAGFVAATFMRGIDLIQVPTTLLAAVDSSIGGKVGVNFRGGKNLVGALHHPKAVLIDPDFFQTLPLRQITSGLGEVIKSAIIGSAPLFRLIEERLDALKRGKELEEVVRRCATIKSRIVSEDELEQGLRMSLNFGHTFGHAFETVAGFERLLHGEAVILGMRCATRLSTIRGWLSSEHHDRIQDLLGRVEIKQKIEEISKKAVIRKMLLDKKVLDGRVRFVLMRKIGDAFVDDSVSKLQIMASMRFDSAYA